MCSDGVTKWMEIEAAMLLQVKPTILTHEEYKKWLSNQESFLTRVIEQPKIWIIGKSRDLSI